MIDNKAASPSVGAISPLAHPWEHSTENRTRTDLEPNNGVAELRFGTVLSARYDVRERIGQGGMGVIYAAWDRQRNQEIAIKAMSAALFANPDAQAQFRREAQITSDLNHPCVVNVYDLQTDGDLAFLTMELLRGKTLRQEMRERKKDGRLFSFEEAKRIILELCGALEYAHHFTVHRDVKPENVWIDSEGRLKLMDFGLAGLMLDQERSRLGASTAGLSMGTPYYMAPEQLKEGGAVDARADQYSAAALFYELLTGTVVAGMIRSVRHVRKDVPHGISKVLHRALSVLPEGRYENIAAFALAIRNGGDPLPWLPRNRTQLTAAFLLIAGISLILFSLVDRVAASWRDAKQRRQEATTQAEALREPIRFKYNRLDSAFTEFFQKIAEVNPDEMGLLDPLALGRLNQKLERGDELLKLGKSIEALNLFLNAGRLANQADRNLQLWTSSRDSDRNAQEIIEFLDTLSATNQIVSASEIERWTLELSQIHTESLNGKVTESVVVLSNLNVHLTEKMKQVALSLYAKADSNRIAWESRFESNSIPTMEFLAPAANRLDSVDQALTQGNYVTAARHSLGIATKYANWITEVEAMHHRTDQFLAELGRPLEFLTNTLGMRFVRVDEKHWVSIWETRMMDYAVFLKGLPHSESTNPDMDWWKHLDFMPSPTQPVIGVSEADAFQFTVWLRNAEHKRNTLRDHETYDLISDTLFENLIQRLSANAGRANTTQHSYTRGVYALGQIWPPQNEEFRQNWRDPAFQVENFLRPVASVAPNSLGIFDFEGNVWERMQEPYDFGAKEYPHFDRYFPQCCGGGHFGKRGGIPQLKIKPGYDWIELQEAIGFRIVLEEVELP